MKEKPPTCLGCPLYGDGKGFVDDEIPTNAIVVVLAQNPGSDEESEGRPLVGATGHMMDAQFVPLTGLTRGRDLGVANILKCRRIVNGRRTNDMPTGATLKAAVEHCTRAHLRIPPSVRLIIAMGAHAVKYMGFPGSVSDWRGYLKPREDACSS